MNTATSTDLYGYHFTNAATVSAEREYRAEVTACQVLILVWALSHVTTVAAVLTGETIVCAMAAIFFVSACLTQAKIDPEHWQPRPDLTLIATVDAWAAERNIILKNTCATVRQIAAANRPPRPRVNRPWTIETHTATGTITLTLDRSGRLTHT